MCIKKTILPAFWIVLSLFPVGKPLSQVTTSEAAGNREWIISGEHTMVHVRLDDLGMDVTAGGTHWETLPSSPGDITVRTASGTHELALKDAESVAAGAFLENGKDGVSIGLDRFPAPEGGYLDLRLRLRIYLEGDDEDVVCELTPEREAVPVVECVWPRGFLTTAADTAVVPFMHGMLLPGDWPKEVRLDGEEAWGRGLYMPWWGFQRGDSAILTILETPDDGGCRFSHPDGGPTRIEPRWRHSLGKLGYPRRTRICRIDRGNYVQLCKRYRRYVVENGAFLSLRDKIRKTPHLERLMGAPVVYVDILRHIQPDARGYDPYHPENNHRLATFDQQTRKMLDLAGEGVKRASIHLDGWGTRGYDNLHPDILPPCPEAGGWEGMRRMAGVCDSLGYSLMLHDQYRDYYLDAPSYDPERTIIMEDGSRPYQQIWNGGAQSLLCPHFAPEYVERNHSALLALGIKVKGAFLDVFAVIPPEECYHPGHTVSRTECRKLRGNCFALIQKLEGIASSEEPTDWAVPYIDLTDPAGHALEPDLQNGNAIGIPTPLFSLVYHDAIIIPWKMGTGGWGVPKGDSGFLYGVLNAGIPSLPLDSTGAEREMARVMCELHAKTGAREMVSHEFIGGNPRLQRSVFSNGTTVTVDFDRGTHEISTLPSPWVSGAPADPPLEAVSFPNPFNSRTVIQFEIYRETAVDVSIFNVLGQKVRTVMTGRAGPGKVTALWDGCDDSGTALASGIYVARVRADAEACSRKIMLLR